MTRALDDKERNYLRRAIKNALRGESWRVPKRGVPKAWYDRRLDTLLGYGVSNPVLPARIRQILSMRFEQGIPLDNVARSLRLSKRQIIRDMNDGLDLIIDNLPEGVIRNLSPERYTWLFRACPNCGGDMYWDAEGTKGADGEYCCNLCAHRYTIKQLEQYDMETVGKLASGRIIRAAG